MYGLLVTIHVLVGIFLIIIVLLQSNKGASLGAAFGGSSQTIFGSRGAGSFLSKLTTASAIVFMLTSLTLAVLSSNKAEKSIIPSSSAEKTGGKETKASPSQETSKGDSNEKGQVPVQH